jgi:hypothetical protein
LEGIIFTYYVPLVNLSPFVEPQKEFLAGKFDVDMDTFIKTAECYQSIFVYIVGALDMLDAPLPGRSA